MSKFITLGTCHLNLDQIIAFSYIKGELVIDFTDKDTMRLVDPDRKLYNQLCNFVGVQPVEV